MAYLPDQYRLFAGIRLGWVSSQLHEISDDMYDAYMAYPHDPETFQAALASMSDHFEYAANYLHDTGSANFWYWLDLALDWIHDNLDSEGNVYNFTDILLLMLEATQDEIVVWSAIVEAFKAAIWDVTFPVQFYEQNVKYFRQWG